jgi:hypothetical protein
MRPRYLLLPLLFACDGSDATYAAVQNRHDTTVYKAWYRTTLFADPVTPGNDAPVHLVAPGGGVAYLLLAPGWDPDAGPPPMLSAAVTGTVDAEKGRIADIVVSKDTLRTACTAPPNVNPLAREDYDLLRERIFPGDNLSPFEKACSP